jgi:hypothetical protein
MRVPKELPPVPDWCAAMQEAWAAVPAAELLSPESEVWAQARLSPPDQAEGASFGIVGRTLKNRESLAVALPLLGGESVTRLMVYLHRVRWDAQLDGIRSPWLNREVVAANPDIVFVTRRQAGHLELSRVPQLHPRPLTPGSRRERRNGNLSETLVIDGGMDLMELTDLVERECRPFVFVIDGTRGGHDSAADLEAALAECFPVIPRILLLSLGDSEALERVRASRSSTHLWVMRLADRASLVPGTEKLQVGIILDRRADELMQATAARFLTLRRLLEINKDPVLKERLAIAGKVFRALNEAVVPLALLEQHLVHSTRPGLFPVRSLGRWLELAQEGSCSHGDAESGSMALVRQLREIHALLTRSETGKAMWLRGHLRAARGKRDMRVLVLCGSRHEASALEAWLDDHLDPEWTTTITVGAMDGVRAYRKHHDAYDEVILTGMLWPSRQHWLAAPGARVTIPAYPYETPQVEKLLNRWWQLHGAPSAPAGDKLRQWRMEWAAGRCLDDDTLPQAPVIDSIKCNAPGNYPAKEVVTVVEFDPGIEDWLELLLEEPTTPTAAAGMGESSQHGVVWIHTKEYGAPLPWPEHARVVVLREEDIEPTRANALEPGDEIVLLRHSEERIATHQQLMELVVQESEEVHQLAKQADRWDALVDRVGARKSVNEIHRSLHQMAITVVPATVRNWLNHRVYGPQNPRAILVFARLAGEADPERTARYIGNAILEVRKQHRAVGMALRQVLLEQRRGKGKVKVGGKSLEFSVGDMVEIVTVTHIEAAGPAPEPVAMTPLPKLNPLVAIAEGVAAKLPNRLIFTPPAEKSMRSSAYADHAKFKAVLELMATELYDLYVSRHAGYPKVRDIFLKENVEFKQKMSDITMGRYSDNRQYKGKSADLNKHLCLGTAFDQAKCLRIHFDWDDEEKCLVIHHAGKHLDNSFS